MSATSPPQPPKKGGFFRRLSLSASASANVNRASVVPSQPHPHPQPHANGTSSPAPPPLPHARSSRAVSGPALLRRDKTDNGTLAGPAYESLPPSHPPLPPLPAQLPAQTKSNPSLAQDYGLLQHQQLGKGQHPQPQQPPMPANRLRKASRDKAFERDSHTPPQVSTNINISPLMSHTTRSPPPNIPSLPSPPPAVPPLPALAHQSSFNPSTPTTSRPASTAAPGSYTPRQVSQRNPIAPMLASPPTSPPLADYEVPSMPTAVTMDGGRFPTPAHSSAQSYSRPPLLGMELPARTSSAAAAARVNGESRRQSTLPPGAAPTFEIIASSSGRRQPQSPPAAQTSLPSPPPVMPALPRLASQRASLPTSTSYGRFDDADLPTGSSSAGPPAQPFPDTFPTLPSGAQAPVIPPLAAVAPSPNAQARAGVSSSTRRSSSQNRGQRAVVSTPEVKRQSSQVLVETLDGDSNLGHKSSSPSLLRGSSPPSSFVAPSPTGARSTDIPFPTRQSMASPPPLTPEKRRDSAMFNNIQQAQQTRTPPSARTSMAEGAKPFPQISPTTSRPERRLSRPLPRPPSQLGPVQTPPRPSVTTGVQANTQHQGSPQTSTATPRKSISPTTSRATMHVIASSNGMGRRDSAFSVTSTDSRGNAASPAPAGSPAPVPGQNATGPILFTQTQSAQPSSSPSAFLPPKPEKSKRRSMSPMRPKIIIPNSNAIPSVVATQPTPSKPKSIATAPPPTQPQSIGAVQPGAAGGIPGSVAMSDPFMTKSNGENVVSLDLDFDFPNSPSLVPLVDPRSLTDKRQSASSSSTSAMGMSTSTSNRQMSVESESYESARGSSPTAGQQYHQQQYPQQQPPPQPQWPRRSTSTKPGVNGLSPLLPSPMSNTNTNGQLSPVLSSTQLPPRVSSAQGRRVASSPLASPVFSSPGQMSGTTHTLFQAYSPQQPTAPLQARAASASFPSPSSSRPVSQSNQGARIGLGIESLGGTSASGSATNSRRGSLAADVAIRQSTLPSSGIHPNLLRPPRRRPAHLSLRFLLGEPAVANSLLPNMSINMFLNLLGSDDALRKVLTGDMIGRWVFKEWGIIWDPERSRSRPGLTVWEGFLESLLHDPAVYCTYPPQYHSLLQHLSLSHTLIVLHLRGLPPSSFPYSAPPPFDDELGLPPALSSSVGSFSGGLRSRSRMGSAAGSDAGSIAQGSVASGKMPRQERVVEIIMPEPLAPQTKVESSGPSEELVSDVSGGGVTGALRKVRRRGSVSSMTSTTSSFAFGRRRANSTASAIRADLATTVAGPAAQHGAALMLQGKQDLPPVSYPSAKRYGFRRHGGDSIPIPRSRTSSESGRPGSIMSVQSSPSMSHHPRMSASYSRSSMGIDRYSFAVDRNAPPVPGLPPHLPVPPTIGSAGGHRASFASSEAGRSSRRSDQGGGGNSPIGRRWGEHSPNHSARDLVIGGQQQRPEPAFDRPPPYTLGRAPILRVFVPTGNEKVPKWPSKEGAAACWHQLEKCGASKRLKLGDLVVNTALRHPTNTEHVLVFVPFVKHLLVPLQYTHSLTGHLPHYVDGLSLPPSYYYPFLPAPQIIYLDLSPFASRSIGSIRLAYDRRDVTVASGARLSAKRYLHVAGLEVRPGDRVAEGWAGMVSLEAEGTAEGKADIEARLGWGDPAKAVMGPWEVVREKSMLGTVWLRLIKEQPGRG